MGKRPTLFRKFLADPTQYPILLTLATGLYPVLFYYTRNYPLINTWRHLWFFIAFFLGVPFVLYWLTKRVFKVNWSVKFRWRLFCFINISLFLNFIQMCLYASVQWMITAAILVIALLLSGFFYSQLKKIVVFQLLLVAITLFWLIPVVSAQLNYSEVWMEQPDTIEEAVLKQRPNIYLIQPDGYVGFAEMNSGYYQIDNSQFEAFLSEQNFTFYPKFRSNYSTTLTSNTSIFSMKHHYYNNGFNFSERMNTREVIISDNAVLRVLRNNNYKTHFLAEWPYLLANLPEMGYDESNFSYDELPYLTTGINQNREVEPYLSNYIEQDSLHPKFFFIELFLPGHIATTKAESTGIETEKVWWTNNLKQSNEKLRSLLDMIQAKDPEAMVVLLSDHGGYVGMEYMRELRTKTRERDKIFSAFSAMLAVKWPGNKEPVMEAEFRSGVNFFRLLFSHLAEEPSYLDHLQDDGSYHLVDRAAPKGVYQYIDSVGEVVFKRQN